MSESSSYILLYDMLILCGVITHFTNGRSSSFERVKQLITKSPGLFLICNRQVEADWETELSIAKETAVHSQDLLSIHAQKTILSHPWRGFQVSLCHKLFGPISVIKTTLWQMGQSYNCFYVLMWNTKTHLKFEDLSSDLISFCLIQNNASLVDCVSMEFSDFILFNWRHCFTSRLCEWNLYRVAFSYFSSMWSNDDDDDVLILSWKWKDLRWLHKLQQKPCMNLSGSWQSFSLSLHLKVQETHSNGT